MAPDWWVYEPGVKVRCPVLRCGAFVAEYGRSIRASVRRHPHGRKGQAIHSPTSDMGEVRPCMGCGEPLELRLEIVDRTARVA